LRPQFEVPAENKALYLKVEDEVTKEAAANPVLLKRFNRVLFNLKQYLKRVKDRYSRAINSTEYKNLRLRQKNQHALPDTATRITPRSRRLLNLKGGVTRPRVLSLLNEQPTEPKRV
jgi:hypothetical protein